MLTINMKHRTTIGILVLSLAVSSVSVSSLFGARNAGPPAPTGGLENGTLALRFSETGLSVLTNKLTGKSYALSAEPFVLQVEIGGIRFRAAAGDFLLIKTENSSPASLRFHYDGTGAR